MIDYAKKDTSERMPASEQILISLGFLGFCFMCGLVGLVASA